MASFSARLNVAAQNVAGYVRALRNAVRQMMAQRDEARRERDQAIIQRDQATQLLTEEMRFRRASERRLLAAEAQRDEALLRATAAEAERDAALLRAAAAETERTAALRQSDMFIFD